MILTAIVTTVLLWTDLSNPYVWAVLAVLIGYGAVGFVDDYRKVVRKNTDGLIARWKYFWQSAIALVVAFALYAHGKDTSATQLVVPFFKDIMPQLGLMYIVLTYFVIVGTSNAVNLTDGLDGLAIMQQSWWRQALRRLLGQQAMLTSPTTCTFLMFLMLPSWWSSVRQ